MRKAKHGPGSGQLNADSFESIVDYRISDSLFYQLDAQILYFNTFITPLYMFRALLCSSSGGKLY